MVSEENPRKGTDPTRQSLTYFGNRRSANADEYAAAGKAETEKEQKLREQLEWGKEEEAEQAVVRT